jgi:hypothetical protein
MSQKNSDMDFQAPVEASSPSEGNIHSSRVKD